MDETEKNSKNKKNIENIKEGLVEIQVPEFDVVSSKAPVFYNSKMELNRDISILVIKSFQKEIEEYGNEDNKEEQDNKENREIAICDVFGGSGIRGIRYKKEIPNVSNVVINDISSLAIEYGKINAINNKVDIDFQEKEANIFLRENRGKFDVIDIDPFGTPSYFIDSAGYSIKKDSLLCVTATDTSALCGTYKEPCIRKYNAKPYKSEYCHENGIRILGGFVALTLAKYKKYIEIKLSHSSEHYMRLYIKIKKGSAATDESLAINIGHIIHCKKCLYRTAISGITSSTDDFCPICGEKVQIAGPLWIGKIQNHDFIGNMIDDLNNEAIYLNTKEKIDKLLNLCLLESDAPITFYDIHVICKNLKISAPKLDKIIETLKNHGYLAIKTHFNPIGIKSNIDIKKLKEIIQYLVD